MNIEATFVRSAAAARDLPQDGLAEIALVGRSNVGKSSLINALVRQRVARTSAAPGKTRLANIYRVARGTADPLYLVDLPGYGYARGGTNELAALVDEYFGGTDGSIERLGPDSTGARASSRTIGALLLVDARHPGLDGDVNAWQWLRRAVERMAVVATKIDKLARGERIRALRVFESVFEDSVLPVSAVTGEGLDQLWKVIEQLRRRNNRQPQPANSSNRRHDSTTGSSNRRRHREAMDRPPLPRPRS